MKYEVLDNYYDKNCFYWEKGSIVDIEEIPDVRFFKSLETNCIKEDVSNTSEFKPDTFVRNKKSKR